MVIWVCEASEVNNLTVLAVGPNHRDNNNNNKDDKDEDKIASSGSDPPMGSDKNRAKGERAKRPNRLNMNNHKTDTGQKYEF